ncbi:DUF3618 domain-containing protein [Streptomyces sp. TR06-5]|uniref:DUF3618 domain-containing protein n=1 Tax=unclassified Streptomyces TaxID=2593676 RepID=UPI00399F9CFF
MSDGRTPADIEADIKRRRQELAVALDEIAVRVHPKTIMGDARAKVAATVDRKVSGVRASMVDEDGALRPERVVPVALAAAVVVGGVVALAVRRRRR